MQPWRPHPHCAPPCLTTTWPISPGRAAPAPQLAVEHDAAADAGAPEDAEQRWYGAPAPSSYSASVPASTSLPSATIGVPSASTNAPRRSKLPSQPARLRAPVTVPASSSTLPGEPTPTASRSRGLEAGLLGRLGQRDDELGRDVGRAALDRSDVARLPAHVAVVVDDDSLDLGATEIDASAHEGSFAPSSGWGTPDRAARYGSRRDRREPSCQRGDPQWSVG